MEGKDQRKWKLCDHPNKFLFVGATTIKSREINEIPWWAKPQVYGSIDVVIKDIVPTGSYEFNSLSTMIRRK